MGRELSLPAHFTVVMMFW